MKKKLLFVAPSAYPLGGVQTWLDDTLLGIKEHNFKPILALTNGNHHNVKKYLEDHPFKQAISVSSPTGSIQGRIEALERLIQKIKPDVIIVVNIVDVYQAVNNLRRKHLTNTRVVTSLHGINPDIINDIRINRNIIDAVVSTNKLTKKLVGAKTGIGFNRSFYASYGVPKTQSCSVLEYSSTTLTIAYVGRIEEDQKRISDLISILSKCLNEIENIEVLIAGDGPKNSILLDWISNSRCSTKITHLGSLNKKELHEKVYTKANILLLTSLWETGPIVAWEAMSYGLTLVSSKYLGHLEEGSLIDGYNCLLFDIGNIDQAVNKIKLATCNTLRMKLIKNAYQLVNTKYSIENSISLWSECLESICFRQPKLFTELDQPSKDTGRLSYFLGQKLSERLRKLLGIRFNHLSAGGEWPHSYSESNDDSAALFEYIENVQND